MLLITNFVKEPPITPYFLYEDCMMSYFKRIAHRLNHINLVCIVIFISFYFIYNIYKSMIILGTIEVFETIYKHTIALSKLLMNTL